MRDIAGGCVHLLSLRRQQMHAARFRRAGVIAVVLALALALALAVVVSPVWAPPALAAGTAGACPDAGGVTVVVDFQGLGGGTVVRCAAGRQSTGLAALKDAGFAVTGTARWGEAFICRIEGKPGADRESCIDTPPASAYWSYWHATAGGSWTYSQYGAASRTPPPGSFEGWSFALNRADTGAPPPRVAPRRPPAAQSPEPPESPQPPPSTTGQPAESGGYRPPAAQREGSPPAGEPRPGPEPGSATRPPASGPASDPAPTLKPPPDAVPGPGTTRPPANLSDLDSAAASSGPGVPAGVVVGLGMLAALLVAAGVTVWRRRQESG